MPGEALETSAIVNAHTDGILGLDVTETYSSLKVLSVKISRNQKMGTIYSHFACLFKGYDNTGLLT